MIETYNCLWGENEGSIVITDLDVDDLCARSGSKDEADEREEHDLQVRLG